MLAGPFSIACFEAALSVGSDIYGVSVLPKTLRNHQGGFVFVFYQTYAHEAIR